LEEKFMTKSNNFKNSKWWTTDIESKFSSVSPQLIIKSPSNFVPDHISRVNSEMNNKNLQFSKNQDGGWPPS